MVSKVRIEDQELVFSVNEESGFFRLSMSRPEIGPQHVEDFLDTTVEWLSTNPQKGILIDFTGVKKISEDFAAQLLHYYEEIKSRGLYVRFVNLAPSLESSVEPSNITVVLSQDILRSDKPRLSAKEILQDLAEHVTDEELMEKHGLSEKGLKSLFRKLLAKGLITKKALARRWGVATDVITLEGDGPSARKIRIDPRAVTYDITMNMSNTEIMKKYKLPKNKLQSLMKKLCEQGFISKETLAERLGH